jgi:hypothetical protein
VQGQGVSASHGDKEAYAGEDDDEPGQTVFCELVDGELPSIGSKDHALGECKRCAFFSKGRCRNGKDCSHCHFPHDERRRRNRRSKVKASAAQVEDGADYEGDSEDDVNVRTEAPAAKLDAVSFSTPVSMPVQTCRQGFDSMLVFGSVTPEMEKEASCVAVSSSLKVTDENDEKEEDADVPAEAFSSLLNETEESPKVAPAKAESVDSGVQLVTLDNEVLQFEEMEALEAEAARLEAEALEAEAARLEAEALAAESEAQRLLEEAIAAEKDSSKTPESGLTGNECISGTIAAFSSYYQDHVLPSCGQAYWASLHASFITAAGTPASDPTHDPTHEKKPSMAREAETTASSGDCTSDAGGHDFSSSCSDPDQKSSSDSDVTSVCGLPEELCAQRPERRHRQIHKEASGASRPSRRSPLWPSRSPADFPTTKTVSPSEAEPKKERTSWASMARARRLATAEDPEVAVVRQARGILNKLTDTNFETLYTQLWNVAFARPHSWRQLSWRSSKRQQHNMAFSLCMWSSA